MATVRDHPGCSANDVAELIVEQRHQTLTRITHMTASGLLINDGDSRRQRLRLPAFAPAKALL
jgi:hypothetical protein